jgi:hypothetical protein
LSARGGVNDGKGERLVDSFIAEGGSGIDSYDCGVEAASGVAVVSVTVGGIANLGSSMMESFASGGTVGPRKSEKLD